MDVDADLVVLARKLAQAAHAGQVDKAGARYMGHIRRVASRVAGDPAAVVVALLHDALEDNTDPALRAEVLTLPLRLLHSIFLLNRSGCPPQCYILRIAADDLAYRVKLADIDDNSAPHRLAALPDATARRLSRKYVKSRAILVESRRSLLNLSAGCSSDNAHVVSPGNVAINLRPPA